MNDSNPNERLHSSDWKTIFAMLDAAEVPADFLADRYEGLGQESSRDFESWTDWNFDDQK